MKDPAALLYIDTWLSSTAEMDADCRGWYLNLLLHQYDKKDLPNDIERLAVLAGVKFSEYERFKQVFEQVLKQKFKQTESGRLANENASEIIRKRETFKDKRSQSGKIGYVIKFAMNEVSKDSEFLEYLKNTINFEEIETNDKQVLKQMLKQVLKLYINGDGDGDKVKNGLDTRTKNFEFLVLSNVKYPEQMLKDFCNYWTEPNKSKSKMRFELQQTWDLGRRLQTWANNQSKFSNEKLTKGERTYNAIKNFGSNSG